MELSYIRLLTDEFEKRKKKNNAYSLRAFAKHLGVSRTTLSEVLSGKRNFSKLSAIKISQKLNFSEEDQKSLLEQIKIDVTKIEKFLEKTKYKQLKEDEFNKISSPIHIAILCLPFLKTHESSSTWIAKKLDIEEHDVEEAIERLKRLNLIEIKNNKIIRKAEPVVTSRNISSGAVREYHRNNLKLAEKKLDTVNVENRLFNAITVSVNKNKIKEADELINEFKQKFVNLIKTDDPEDIYTLSIQFFPITKLEEK